MPISLNITQNTGVVAAYHVISNAVANLEAGQGNVTVKSYLSSTTYQAQNQPVSVWTADISPLVTGAIVAATNLTEIIEEYLITTPVFSGGSIVA